MSVPTPEDIDRAIKELEQYLNAPQTRKELWLVHKYDQFAAQLRDMTDDDREKVAKNLSKDKGISLNAARDWIESIVKYG